MRRRRSSPGDNPGPVIAFIAREKRIPARSAVLAFYSVSPTSETILERLCGLVVSALLDGHFALPARASLAVESNPFPVRFAQARFPLTIRRRHAFSPTGGFSKGLQGPTYP